MLSLERLQKMKTCQNSYCKSNASSGTKHIRNIAVVTGTRAEYGILRNLLVAINEHKRLNLQLIVTGMHLLRDFGYTIGDIRNDKFKIAAKVSMYKSADDLQEYLPQALARASEKIGKYVLGNDTHFIVVLGDRLEAFAGALAGLTANVPVVHLHGGELAPGDMDDRIRYAISSIANIHCVATSEAKRRLIRTGQNPEHIFVTGALALDEIFNAKRLFSCDTKKSICQKFNLNLNKPIAIILHHPAGFGAKREYMYMKNILKAAGALQGIIIGSNNDPGHSGIKKAIDEFLKRPNISKRWRYCQSLIRSEYLRTIYAADILIGNSSSGIFEANALGTAVVNIGPRQLNRQRNGNAIFDASYTLSDIRNAIREALRFANTNRIRSSRKFGKGTAGFSIADILANIEITRSLRIKTFFTHNNSEG